MGKARKLKVSRPDVAHATAGYERRRMRMLKASASGDLSADLYGSRAIANLFLNRRLSAANASLRRVAEWFDHPHPYGRDHRGECDFAAIKLCLAYCLFRRRGVLEPGTLERIQRFFLTMRFESMYGSENHVLLFRTSRYLMSRVYGRKQFQPYGRTGRELEAEDRVWLDRYIRFRAQRGWGEFDSSCYILPEWECLAALYDFAPDKQIRALARNMLNLLLADMAVDSLNGMHGGAHGRIYEQHALDHATTHSYALQHLYFGNVDPETMEGRGGPVEALTSRFRPHPLVLAIALDRTETYENRERKHLHNTDDCLPRRPLAGSIRKYTWWTPQFLLGCVQYQDPYPATCKGRWYAHHEQHQWDMTVGTRTQARIFTHHPGESGPEHGYWTGDLRCGCGHFFQNRTALLALYDIPRDQPLQWIHAHVPKAAFDEVKCRAGFIFVREGEVYAALKMLGGHRWTRSGKWKDMEVRSYGGKNGAICEVGQASEFADFTAFQREILSNPIQFDRRRMRLRYASKRNGVLEMDTRGKRRFNGRDEDLNYATFENPFMKSRWRSGVIELRKGKWKLKLDFTSASN